jgi:N-acetylglucosaminyldiphosphoundecaprenol N-acetyl-beta-D-mannosaminyltransferase
MKERKVLVLGIPISLVNYEMVIHTIQMYVKNKKSAYICVAATHLIVECQNNIELKQGVTQADVVTPDGMPIVWLLKLLGYSKATRVYGPQLTEKICQLSANQKYRIYILGGAYGQSKKLKNILSKRFSGIQIVGNFDTPDKLHISSSVISNIKKTDADIVLVGLGCPYQELWMIRNSNQLRKQVLVGVGAAFDILSGKTSQAPPLVQNAGLEWFYRLIHEPKRLWKRYFINNSLFIYYFFKWGILHKFNMEYRKD